MKKLLSFLSIVFVTCALGCASAERNAHIAIGTVGTTADAAIGAYGEYISTHPVPREQVLEVRRTVKAYVAAVDAAKLAVTAYKTGTTDKPTLDRAIDALSAASAEVVRVIELVTSGGAASQSGVTIPLLPRALRNP